MAGEAAWAALIIHHERDGEPAVLAAGEQIPEWVGDDLLADWIAGGAATTTKPEDDD